MHISRLVSNFTITMAVIHMFIKIVYMCSNTFTNHCTYMSHIIVTYYCHILLYNINIFMLITFALIAFTLIAFTLITLIDIVLLMNKS